MRFYDKDCNPEQLSPLTLAFIGDTVFDLFVRERLVCLANFCTANNTIAIITTGPIVKDISDKFGIAPRKTASILDTFSCLIQGLLPYGAQLLMASSLAGISSSSIIPFLYYPFIMGACAILAIVVDYPKK